MSEIGFLDLGEIYEWDSFSVIWFRILAPKVSEVRSDTILDYAPLCVRGTPSRVKTGKPVPRQGYEPVVFPWDST